MSKAFEPKDPDLGEKNFLFVCPLMKSFEIENFRNSKVIIKVDLTNLYFEGHLVRTTSWKVLSSKV